MEYFLHNVKVAAVICLSAYLLTKNPSFYRALWMTPTIKDKVFLSVLFGALSVIGNALGVTVFNDVMVQSRQIGPIVGGIIAGPFVGIAAGVMGGIHRFFMPGFVAAPALISNIVAGAVGGAFYYKYRERRLTFAKALIAGVMGELVWVVLVLLLAKPAILARLMIGMIGMTTLIVNSLGVAIFVTFIKDIQHGKNLAGADYAEKALEIAKQTLPVLKSGFNEQTAKKIAEIIYKIADIHAIAITDTRTILAYKGLGDDHHIPGFSVLTSFSQQAIKFYDNAYSDIFIANSKEEIGCPEKSCPLDSAIMAPLICNQEVIGYIKAYKSGDIIRLPDIKMLSGIASLLSLQLENTRLDEQAKLLAKTEYAALRAQINPHFLFNTLSVIKLLIRTDPNQAREVILNVANFFRKTLNHNDDIILFVEEIDVIKLYISIQKVRFGDRLQVDFDISEECEEVPFPAFALQPLVENSMNHGLSKKTGPLYIKISGEVQESFLFVSIADNGLGFPAEVIEAVRNDHVNKEMGIGLTNINRRLKSLYGKKYKFHLENTPKGAEVIIKIPITDL